MRAGLATTTLAFLFSVFTARADTVQEFAIDRPDYGAPFGISSGPDGKVWFSQAGAIASYSPTTRELSTYPLSSTSLQVRGIAAGPDGNVWFIEHGGNAVGRITPSGVITEFPLPTPDSYPERITAGPDGNLWFTEFAGRIGRITPEGVITEFTAPVSAFGITAGPDGNLWFTELNSNKVAWISTAGAITEESITLQSPGELAFGDGGALFITKWFGNTIYRRDPLTHSYANLSTGSGEAFTAITRDPNGWGMWIVDSNGYLRRLNATTGAFIGSYGLPGSGELGVAVGPDGRVWTTYQFGVCAAERSTGAVSQTIPTWGLVFNPTTIVAGPDGNLWFTEPQTSRVGRLTTGGTTLSEIVLRGSPYGIASGPGGKLWVTQRSSTVIASITPGGPVTEYWLPSPSASPAHITSGPDGNVWFTEPGTDRIGRMTTSGGLTEFALTSGSSPFGIAAGPDGNLWFTEQAANAVGSITPAGTITEFPIPTPNSSPACIAAGPDGALWFTESAADKVARIAVDGTITEFAIPTAGGHPWGIVSDPACNRLWITEKDGSKVASVTVSGSVVETTTISGASAPLGICAGPDGNIWFAESASARLGKVVPPPGPTATVSGTATICSGSSTSISAALTGTGPWNVTWSDGVSQNGVAASPATRSVGPTSNTTYTVTVVTDANCTGTASGSAVITVNSTTPTPTAASDSPVCAGGTLHLTASTIAGATYAWTGPNGFTSTAQNPTRTGMTAADAGTYSVTATVTGCASSAGSTAVAVNAKPATPTIAAPSAVASGSPNRTASVAAHAGSTYAWNVTNGTITAGQGTAQVTFTAGGTGTLTLTVTETDANGCTSLAGSANVNVLDAWSAVGFYTAIPCRILDTRNPAGPRGGPAFGPSQARTFQVAGVCGIPAAARALSVNVTVTNPAAPGGLTTYRADIARPLASSISFAAGLTRANNGILQLSNDGNTAFTIFNASNGTTDVIVDVNGWFE